jgi:Transcriptional regulators
MDKLDGRSLNPLYKQLKNKLYQDIKSGVYPIHSRIPSEAELCDYYGVSRVTVRKSLAELTEEGLLLRIQGKGTFIAMPKVTKNLSAVTGFSGYCRDMGKTPSAIVIQTLTTNPSVRDMADLDLCEDASVIETVRLRLADGMPVMLEKNVFPNTYAYLLDEDLSSSLYAILLKHHVEVARATHDISLCHATASQAKHLEIQPGEALLQLYEVIYDKQGQPIHTSQQVIRGDRFIFRI